jgi:type II secretory pathway predicted ATPase ExeA
LNRFEQIVSIQFYPAGRHGIGTSQAFGAHGSVPSSDVPDGREKCCDQAETSRPLSHQDFTRPAYGSSIAISSALLNFYRLSEQPFGATPDPNYLYFSPGHREALASLLYGIETGRGFLSLVAEPGMGKTTLLFRLLQRWKGSVHCAFLFQTQCDSRELIRYLMNDLGLRSDGEDIVRMHSELNEFLFRESLANRQVVVFIDEAQNLSDTVLETVRLLSDFEATDKKLLQIVLAGQPELAKRLSNPGLAQLRQRIAVNARLDPLSPTEVVQYINHRLQVAGHPETGLFTPGALELTAQYSRGIPRVINNLCFAALSLGCALQSKQITCEIVRKAAADLALDPRALTHPVLRQQTAPRVTRGLRGLFQTSIVSLVIGGLAIYFGMHSGSRATQPSPEIRRIVASAPKAPEPQSPAARAVAGNLDAVRDQQAPQAVRRGDSLAFFTYVVQPHDTLRDLCMATFGRYDHAILAEIQKLNPELKDRNHLDVGQAIRLPLNYSK